MSARYVLGIDLGTTNSVLAYALLDDEKPQVKLLPIPQFVDANLIESRTSLPSFLYLATPKETENQMYDLPGANQRSFVVGEAARRKGAELPERTVGAAKSWLCHTRIDRHEEILPWQAPEEVPKISPVTASRRYLEHLIAAWEEAFPDAPAKDQQVVLTVPASFDASARELTREAALAAGLPDDLVLLEEPQAAIYSWLEQVGDRWRKLLKVGDVLLVCDIGGGTTDLTLVEVGQEDGNLILQRKAVGNHLLVGGDNMDLALAHYVATLFADKGIRLDPWQSVSLWHSCRQAKETLLTEGGPETHPISVLGRGSKLIGGTVSVDVPREPARKLLADGFFPQCDIGETPKRQRMSGFQEIGLPFEADTAITRHVAAFLTIQGEDGQAVQPTHILFNGGVFKSLTLERRFQAAMIHWFGETPEELAGSRDLDHAVAKGAAHYGWSKRRGGIRIRGGTARAYYVGIETAGLAVPGAPRPLRALCVVPMGMEEGTETDVPSQEIGLIIGEPAQFRFFASPIRRDDRPGKLLTHWTEDELSETAPLETTLTGEDGDAEAYVPVRFHAKITELGLLELWCVNRQTDQRWKLEFSVREED